MHYYSLLGNYLSCDRGYIWSHTSVSTLILHTQQLHGMLYSCMIYVYIYTCKSLECNNYETLVAIAMYYETPPAATFAQFMLNIRTISHDFQKAYIVTGHKVPTSI